MCELEENYFSNMHSTNFVISSNNNDSILLTNNFLNLNSNKYENKITSKDDENTIVIVKNKYNQFNDNNNDDENSGSDTDEDESYTYKIENTRKRRLNSNNIQNKKHSSFFQINFKKNTILDVFENDKILKDKMMPSAPSKTRSKMHDLAVRHRLITNQVEIF